jgi:hypothetical protein
VARSGGGGNGKVDPGARQKPSSVGTSFRRRGCDCMVSRDVAFLMVPGPSHYTISLHDTSTATVPSLLPLLLITEHGELTSDCTENRRRGVER